MSFRARLLTWALASETVRRWRERRYELFVPLCDVRPGERILEADRYFVQTPNRFLPVEPHYQLPFFQFLPRRAQRWLVASFALGWHERGQWEEITLLSAAGLARLFPEAEIHRERVLGLTKSLLAVRC